MLETDVALEYDCPHCSHPVVVKLICSGRGVAGGHAVTSVTIPCPTCERKSELVFEISGLILQVTPERKRPTPEPSLN
jgi:hypothetical protein